MNEQLSEFARNTLKVSVEKLTSNQVKLFKRMYSHENLEKSINNVIDDMPDDKLDWAMTQIENSL